MKQQVATHCKCKSGQEKKSSYRNHIAILSKNTQYAELQVSISWAGILLANKQLTCTKELGLMYYSLGVQISYCYISWSHWECNPQRHSSASMDEFLMEEPAFASEKTREYWITASSPPRRIILLENWFCLKTPISISPTNSKLQTKTSTAMQKVDRKVFQNYHKCNQQTWYSRSQGSEICKPIAIFPCCKLCMHVASGCIRTRIAIK